LANCDTALTVIIAVVVLISFLNRTFIYSLLSLRQ